LDIRFVFEGQNLLREQTPKEVGMSSLRWRSKCIECEIRNCVRYHNIVCFLLKTGIEDQDMIDAFITQVCARVWEPYFCRRMSVSLSLSLSHVIWISFNLFFFIIDWRILDDNAIDDIGKCFSRIDRLTLNLLLFLKR
jgi:hypothetical protein